MMLGLEPRQVSDPQDLSIKFLDFWPVALSLLADPKQLLSDLETVSIIIFFFFFSSFPLLFLPFLFFNLLYILLYILLLNLFSSSRNAVPQKTPGSGCRADVTTNRRVLTRP